MKKLSVLALCVVLLMACAATAQAGEPPTQVSSPAPLGQAPPPAALGQASPPASLPAGQPPPGLTPQLSRGAKKALRNKNRGRKVLSKRLSAKQQKQIAKKLRKSTPRRSANVERSWRADLGCDYYSYWPWVPCYDGTYTGYNSYYGWYNWWYESWYYYYAGYYWYDSWNYIYTYGNGIYYRA